MFALAEEKDVADLVDSTLMYLRPLFEHEPLPVEQVHQVLDFFGWQQGETQGETGHWTHPDRPGLSATLSTDPPRWTLSDANGTPRQVLSNPTGLN